MNAIWVVVADSTRARLFSTGEPSGSLTEFETLVHPESRLHQGDLVADRAGRDRGSDGSSHDMSDATDAKREEAVRFACQVSELLEAGRISGAFDRLYLVVAPEFLGILRKRLPQSLQRLVSREVSKNLAAHQIGDIRKYLPHYL